MTQTLLVISLPGTGKTTAAKILNFAEKEFDRPAIDFDYRGTRFKYDTASDVRVAQAKLFNSFASHNVRVIFTHWNAVRFDSLNINKFKVLFVFPTSEKINQILTDIRNRDSQDSMFYEQCVANYYQWVSEAARCYDKVVRRFKENCFKLYIDKDEYVLDALYSLPTVRSCAYAREYNLKDDILQDCLKVIRNPEAFDLYNRSVLKDIRKYLVQNINMFMSYQADSGYVISKTDFCSRWNENAYSTFLDILFDDIIGNRAEDITYTDILYRMKYDNTLQESELYNADDIIDKRLSYFAN